MPKKPEPIDWPNMEVNTIIHGDCLERMQSMPSDSVDLVMCSPPYEDARLYAELKYKTKGQDWVDWMMPRVTEMARVSKGLVVVVCEGKTRNYRYSATPILLMADLHRAGFNLRKPAIFRRVGIPGSGGPDWLRNDYEFCICITPKGKLPWSDNKAMGKPPKYPPGGRMSNRNADGVRKNARDHDATRAARASRFHEHTKTNGDVVIRENRIKSHIPGMHAQPQSYSVPAIANPGNVIKCIVGGGVMGSRLAAENEAPYPESLCEFFIRSFCPPNGIVLDPFSGSGTTLAVAEKHGRQWIGIDCRESQVELGYRRIAEVRSKAGVA